MDGLLDLSGVWEFPQVSVRRDQTGQFVVEDRGLLGFERNVRLVGQCIIVLDEGDGRERRQGSHGWLSPSPWARWRSCSEC